MRRWRAFRARFRPFRWLALLLLAAVLAALVDGWKAFGHRAEGARLARMQRSPQWKDGHFANPQPLANDFWEMLTGLLHVSEQVSPSAPLRALPLDPKQFRSPPESGLRVTWLGHASLLLEIGGKRLLTDPVWSERASPFRWVGPVRWYAPPIALNDLLPIDAVLISHDHYDHLDYQTVVALSERGARFVVPLGIGAHLAYWGVPEARIIELDWWERTRLGELEIVCTPARHASGRHLFDKDSKLWAGYALLAPEHRIYLSGDTGLFPALRQIGERLGPFDLALIEAGQYHRAWPDWHIGPEQAVTAAQMLRASAMLPMHWGLFALAYHGWTEPVERVVAAAERANLKVIAPRPGQSVEPQRAPELVRWWPKVPWETAAQHPIVSTRVN